MCRGNSEALPAPIAQRARRVLGARVHNLYGPTEASVDVSYWECPRAGGGANVPIGRPIANTALYVLDAQLQLLPPIEIGRPETIIPAQVSDLLMPFREKRL